MNLLAIALSVFSSSSALADSKVCQSVGEKKICGYQTLQANGALLITEPTVIYTAYWRADLPVVEDEIKNNKAGANLICKAFGKTPTGRTKSIGSEVYFNAKTGERTYDSGFAPLYNPKAFSEVECQ